MYPLADDELPLYELVEHWDGPWERESSSAQLYTCLLQYFWRGELPLRGSLSPLPWERRELIDAIHEVLPPDEVEEMFALLEQAARDAGANVIYVPRKVLLPAEPNKWTEAELEAAFAVLAEWKSAHYSNNLFAGLIGQLVHRDDFAAWCDRRGWPRPSFWFRTKWPSKGERASRDAKYTCRRWLRKCAATGTPRRPKATWRAEALRQFPGLSKRAFDRIWARNVPLEWKEAGRRAAT